VAAGAAGGLLAGMGLGFIFESRALDVTDLSAAIVGAATPLLAQNALARRYANLRVTPTVKVGLAGVGTFVAIGLNGSRLASAAPAAELQELQGESDGWK